MQTQPNEEPVPQTVEEIKAFIRRRLDAEQLALTSASGLNVVGKRVAAEIRDMAKSAVAQAQRGGE